MSKTIKKRKGINYPSGEPGYTYLTYDELVGYDATKFNNWENWEVALKKFFNNDKLEPTKKKKSYQPDWL